MVQRLPWAITGGPATGKTTILEALKSHGMSTVSADELSAQVLSCEPIAEEVADCLGLPKPLQRNELRSRVVNDVRSRRKLNEILHPHVLRLMEESNSDVCEVPLLIETCLQHRFQKVILAWCDEKTQRERLARRLGSDAEIDAWIAIQLPLDSKIAHSDWIVRTNMPMPNVRDDIATLIEAWR